MSTSIHSTTMNHDPLLFALNASRLFGEQLAQRLGVTLSPHEEREFEDGEHKARPLVNVRGRHVFLVHSLYADQDQSGNDKLCRLLFFIGALKDASAARVTAIVPYLAYARKDRKTKPRDPVTTKYVAALFEAVGTDAIVTMDVHNLAAYQNAFRCPTENLEANKLFASFFAPLVRDQEVVVVSPDAGGIKRAERFRQLMATMLGKPVGAAFAEKHRSSGVVRGEMLVGEVKDRTVIIIDDLISTGNTLMKTARSCRSKGATHVFAAATHGLFNQDACVVLAGEELERIVVADTVPLASLKDSVIRDKIALLSTAALFAEAIQRMHGNGSVTELAEF